MAFDLLLFRLRIPKPVRQLLGWWPTLADKGFYGSLDYLAFCFLDDAHVPHRACWHEASE